MLGVRYELAGSVVNFCLAKRPRLALRPKIPAKMLA